MNKTKVLGLLLLAGSLALFAWSGLVMSQRLAHREVPLIWIGEPAVTEEFEYDGEPVVLRSVPAIDTEAGEKTNAESSSTTIELSYRNQTLRFDLPVQEDPRLPGLLRWGDWMKAIPLAELPAGTRGGGDVLNDLIEKGEVRPRLVVAVRQLPKNFDPQTWGTVRRKDWSYRFYELLPQAPESQSIISHERDYGELQDLAELYFETLDLKASSSGERRAAIIFDETTKFREKYGARAEDESLWAAAASLGGLARGSSEQQRVEAVTSVRSELRQRFWQYQAMLMVTPKLQMPRTKVVDYGISSMGWTWPVAGISVLGILAGIWLIMISGVREPTD